MFSRSAHNIHQLAIAVWSMGLEYSQFNITLLKKCVWTAGPQHQMFCSQICLCYVALFAGIA